MQRHEAELEAERLVNLHQTIRETAQRVYKLTEQFVDAIPDRMRNELADRYVDFAYDDLRRADKLIELGKIFLSLKAHHLEVYPSYPPAKGFSAHLENRSNEQKDRLDHHLRFVCLRDSGELLPRKNASESVIDGMLDIYTSRDGLFYELDRNTRTRELSDYQVRLLDGLIESSIEFVEVIAGVVRESTKLVPPR